jgi:hypothetical protein
MKKKKKRERKREKRNGGKIIPENSTRQYSQMPMMKNA